MKMNKKGFTLIEMLVVIAIIAVLVAIVVPTVSSATTKAKAAADAANLRTAMGEAQIYVLNENLEIEAKTFTADEVASVGTVCKQDGSSTLVVTMSADGEIEATFNNGTTVSYTLAQCIENAGGNE